MYAEACNVYIVDTHRTQNTSCVQCVCVCIRYAIGIYNMFTIHRKAVACIQAPNVNILCLCMPNVRELRRRTGEKHSEARNTENHHHRARECQSQSHTQRTAYAAQRAHAHTKTKKNTQSTQMPVSACARICESCASRASDFMLRDLCVLPSRTSVDRSRLSRCVVAACLRQCARFLDHACMCVFVDVSVTVCGLF